MATVVWNHSALDAFVNGPNGAIARDLARRAVNVETQAKINLNQSFPPASVPGEPPHKRSGRLQTSVTWQLGQDSIGLYAIIGSNVEYAEYLELGTDKMAPRPWLRPALVAAG